MCHGHVGAAALQQHHAQARIHAGVAARQLVAMVISFASLAKIFRAWRQSAL